MTDNDNFVQGAINAPDDYSDMRKAVTDGNMTTRSVVARAASDQRAFVADSGEQTVSDVVRFYAENTSSDRLVVVYKFEWYNGGTEDYFADIIKNPTSGIPTNEVNYINLYSPAGTTAPNTVVDAFFGSGTTSLSGGDNTGVQLTVPQGPDQQEFAYYLEPGESIGINLDTGGGLTDATAKFALFFFEVQL